MYILTTHTGEKHTFATMGEVLHHLNTAWEYGENPYTGKSAEMQLEYDKAVYPIVQNGREITPSLVNDTGSAYEILSQWLGEVIGYAKDEVGAIMPPHQIKRSHWLAIKSLSSVAYGVYPAFSQRQCSAQHFEGDKTFHSLSHYCSTKFFHLFGYGHNGPAYDGHDTNSRHEVHVWYALARGDHVPEVVMADYNEPKESRQSGWESEVIKKPFLRGRFQSISHLRVTVNLLRWAGKELTEENTPYFESLLSSLPPKAEDREIDNLFYQAGVLTVKERPPTTVDIGTPYNDFAARLRVMLAEWRRTASLKKLGHRESQTTYTLREYDSQLAETAKLLDQETHDWPNKVASALANKNLPFLLSVLDGPSNETSQKAVEKECNVKLRNVPAAQRRRAIFAIAGFVDEASYRAEEARLDAAQKARKAERDFEAARTRAGNHKIRLDNAAEPMTCAEFVEILVHRGHTKVDSIKKGACSTYYLTNPATREGYPILKSNGTLEYAQLLLEKVAA